MATDEVLIRVVAFMFVTLITMVGWIGARLHSKLDEFGEKLDTHRANMGERLARVESSIDHLEDRLEHIERSSK